MILATTSDFLDYGALGLAAMIFLALVAFAKWAITSMMKSNRIMSNAMNRLADALKTRPCLQNDRIFNDGTLKGENES